MWLDILYIVIGLFLLVKGGDFLVDSGVALAQHARVSKMIIGLTVIGFGTSMPELLVSVQSALQGNVGIAIGNVVGSNIANIALILGVSALICPIPAKKSTIYIDIPFMLVACSLFVSVAMSGSIGRTAGICFLLILITYVSWKVYRSRMKKEEFEAPKMGIIKALFILALSFTALVWGSNVLIEGSSNIARHIGVSDRMIGLTIVAIGTSLPELFASVMAAYKGESDMAIGNIIGSVSFNILSVIGMSAAICPIGYTREGFVSSYLLMVALGVLLWIFTRTRYTLERWEGAILFVIFIGFMVNTIMKG